MQMQIIIEKFLRHEKSHIFKLNQSDRILLIIIASWMGNKNECWPPYKKLMQDTGISSKSTLNKSIKKLEDLKILQVERYHRKNNLYTFDNYFINSWVQICTQTIKKCTQLSTDMDSNNINNNIKNNRQSYPQAKNYTGPIKTSEKPSIYLEEFMKNNR